MTGRVTESWKRIAAWYGVNTPPGTLRPPPGAAEGLLRETEAKLGTRLPEDVREFYRLHDGLGGSWLLHHGELLSLAGVLRQWEMYCEWQRKDGYGIGPDWEPQQLSGPIKPVWWNPRRIHLTDNSGNHRTLDLDPLPGGRLGQILWHDHEVGPVEVLAPSFAAWLSGMADELEAGVHGYSESSRMVCPVAWGRN
jgi:cell wall assembly regulator SMI1